MTEASLQEKLAPALLQPGDLAVIPNCAALFSEADLLRVTKNRHAFEYEIKTSRADFRADFKKQHRKMLAQDIQKGISDKLARYWPNRLIYVAPAGVIPHEEVPKWAGLIEVTLEAGSLTLHRVKNGSRIHDFDMTDRALDYVLRGLSIRYWQARQKLADSV